MGNEPSKQLPPRRSTVSSPQKLPSDAASEVKRKTVSKASQYPPFTVYILGDKATGKTRLLKTLSKSPDRASTSYSHTTTSHKIQVPWNFALSEISINVDVWEIIETSKPSSDPKSNLSIVNEKVHAVIFMIDPRKKSTLDFVKRELKRFPVKIPTLLASNFTDSLGGNVGRQISLKDIQNFAVSIGDHVNYCELSLEDQFGMKAVRSFMSIPFAQYELNLLQQEVERAQRDLLTAVDGFQSIVQEQNYEFYKDWLSKTLTERVKDGSQKRTEVRNTSPVPKPKPTESQESAKPLEKKLVSNQTSDPSLVVPKPKQQQQSPKTLPNKTQAPAESQNSGFFGKLKSMVSSEESTKPTKQPAKQPTKPKSKQDPRATISELKKVAQTKETSNVSIDDFDPSALDDNNDYADFFGSDDDNIPDEPFKEESSEEEGNSLVESDEDFSSVPDPSTQLSTSKSSKVSQQTNKTNKTNSDSFYDEDTSTTPSSTLSEQKALSTSGYESDDEKSNPLVALPEDEKDDYTKPNSLVTVPEDDSDDDTPNPLVTIPEDDSDDDKPNPLVVVAEDDSDDDKPNPFVTIPEENDSDDDKPNPLVAVAEDDSDDDKPNPFVTIPEENDSDDDKPNPLVAVAEDDSDDDKPNPFVTIPEENEPDDDKPNPLVAVAEDDSDNDKPNPFVTIPEGDLDEDKSNPFDTTKANSELVREEESTSNYSQYEAFGDNETSTISESVDKPKRRHKPKDPNRPRRKLTPEEKEQRRARRANRQ